MRGIGALAIVTGLAITASLAEVRTSTVQYKEGETALEGIVAWDDAVKGRRPGILVVHEWTGVGPYVKSRAEQLAKLGYVAFCVDVYGKGVRPVGPKEAGETAGRFKEDRPLLRRRVAAGLEELRRNELADPRRIAAVGYCFGGTAVLELARSGADVAGVVSFHGGLSTPLPASAGSLKAKVLVLHGADDPFVPAAEVTGFEAEMRRASADWQLVAYGGAVHSFSNPASGSDRSKGAAYDPRADRRSWEAMLAFFGELFGESARR